MNTAQSPAALVLRSKTRGGDRSSLPALRRAAGNSPNAEATTRELSLSNKSNAERRAAWRISLGLSAGDWKGLRTQASSQRERDCGQSQRQVLPQRSQWLVQCPCPQLIPAGVPLDP